MVVSATGTPVLEHSVGLEEVSDWTNALGDWSQEPTSGKLAGRSPRSMHAVNERYVVDT